MFLIISNEMDYVTEGATLDEAIAAWEHEINESPVWSKCRVFKAEEMAVSYTMTPKKVAPAKAVKK